MKNKNFGIFTSIICAMTLLVGCQTLEPSPPVANCILNIEQILDADGYEVKGQCICNDPRLEPPNDRQIMPIAFCHDYFAQPLDDRDLEVNYTLDVVRRLEVCLRSSRLCQ